MEESKNSDCNFGKISIMPDGTGKVNAAVTLGYERLRFEPDMVRKLIEEVKLSAVESERNLDKARCDCVLGWLALDNAEYQTACKIFADVLSVFDKCGATTDILRGLNGLSAAHFSMGYYKTALLYFKRLLNTAELGVDDSRLLAILINLGEIYAKLNRLDEGKKVLDKALKMNPDTISKQIIFTRLSTVYRKTGDFHGALSFAKNAVAIAELNGNAGFLPGALCAMGKALKELGDFETAISFFERAVTIARMTNQKDSLTDIYLGFSQLEQKTGRPEQAFEFARKAIKEASSINARPLLEEAYYEMYLAAKATGDPKTALESLEQNRRIHSELFNEQTDLLVNEMNSELAKVEASEYRKNLNRVSIVTEIGYQLTSTLDFKYIYENLFQRVNGLIDAFVFGIALFDKNTRTFNFDFLVEDQKIVQSEPVSVEESNCAGCWCFRNERDVFISDNSAQGSGYFDETVHENKSSSKTESLIYCLLKAKTGILGFLMVQSKQKNAYSSEDFELIKGIVPYLSIAIENASLFNRIKSLAELDELTRLYNRRYIFEIGRNEFARSKRYGMELTVLMMDIDHFKIVNDLYGHDAGDLVLKSLGNAIKGVVRTVDWAGRYGGEEFLLLLPETAETGAVVLAERLRVSVEEMEIQTRNGHSIQVTCSIGINSLVKEAGNFDLFVRKADNALYAAKERGRNQVVVYERDYSTGLGTGG